MTFWDAWALSSTAHMDNGRNKCSINLALVPTLSQGRLVAFPLSGPTVSMFPVTYIWIVSMPKSWPSPTFSQEICLQQGSELAVISRFC